MDIVNELRKVIVEDKKAFDDIIGQVSIKRQLNSALIAGRNILIVGPPGIGKTTLAKNIAKLLPDVTVNDCPYHCSPDAPVCPSCKSGNKISKKKVRGIDRFIRVQGSPDLTAEDLIGDIDPARAIKFGPLSMEAFTPGKIFKANNGVLFFDELNRAPEKLQNSLLQALQERAVTVGSYTVDMQANFIFVATMNPEDSSTEPLSEVLLDRFDVIYMSYPETLADEEEIVEKYSKHFIEVPQDIKKTMVSYVRTLRDSERLERMPSVRASIGLFERSQTNALLKGKSRVDWKDVEEVLVSVLSHRIKLKPSAQYLQTPQELIKETLKDFMEQHGVDKQSKDGEVP